MELAVIVVATLIVLWATGADIWFRWLIVSFIGATIEFFNQKKESESDQHSDG